MSSTAPDDSTQAWGTFRKSRFSMSGDCVEIAFTQPGEVLVRDSKDPAAAVLSFTPSEWSAFVQGVKSDEFNHPWQR